MHRYFIAVSMTLSLSAFGALAEFQGTPKPITASGITVNVYPEAKVKIGATEMVLKNTGAGIRKKAVVGPVKVNVYTLASWVVAPEGLNPDPIEGLKKSEAKLLQMTFLRDISGLDLKTSFHDSLKANGVDVNKTSIQNLLSNFTFDLKAGQTGTMLAELSGTGGMEKLRVEIADKAFEESDNELGTDIWRIWFGKVTDADLEVLKKALLGK